MIVAIAMGSQSWRRVETRMIFHRLCFKRSVLILSCAIFLLAVLCQFPPSTSTAILSERNARSILNLSNANEGIGFHPSLFNTLASADSYLLIFAFLCLPFALLQRSSWERFLPVMIARLAAVIRSCSAYVRRLAVKSAASEIERFGIPYRSSQRCTVGRETLWILAMSCAELFPCQYASDSHSREGIGNLLSIPIMANIPQIEIICNMNGTHSLALPGGNGRGNGKGKP